MTTADLTHCVTAKLLGLEPEEVYAENRLDAAIASFKLNPSHIAWKDLKRAMLVYQTAKLNPGEVRASDAFNAGGDIGEAIVQAVHSESIDEILKECG